MNKLFNHILFILALLTFDQVSAQNTHLSGKWQLIEMQQDSLIIFNRDNPEITIEQAWSRQNPLDSLAIMHFRHVIHPMMKKLYYEFLANGHLSAGVLVLKDEEYIFTEKPGTFNVDGEKLGISISGGIDSYVYSLNDGILTLIPIIDDAIYDRGYAKYKQLK